MSTNAKPLPNKDIRNDRRVLVVEDERDLSEMLRFHLERAGYSVSVASDGRSAIQKVQEAPPDLILLDLMLPELSGTEVASRVRSNPETAQTPIIMLTAKAEEVDQIVGLSVGADDYITKPFSMKVVLARVEAVLRRTKGTAGSEATVQRLGPIEVNQDTHEVTVTGESIKLTLTEFRLLSALIAAQGKVLSRHLLMRKAMGPGVTVTERTIDVHITAVRRKLGDHGSIIRTVRGVGYRATQEPETSDV
jgi:DNA-binding response OmpR family regulator